MYRIAGNFWGRKLSRISRIGAVPRKFFPWIFWGHGTHDRGVVRNTQQAHAYSRHHLPDQSTPFNMSLLKYFQTNSSLPKPDGPLSTVVPSSSIVAADKRWNKLDKPEGGRHPDTESKRETYESFTPEEKARTGNGPRSTVWQCQFTTSRSLTNRSLKESTVRTSWPCRCSAFTGSALFVFSIS